MFNSHTSSHRVWLWQTSITTSQIVSSAIDRSGSIVMLVSFRMLFRKEKRCGKINLDKLIIASNKHIRDIVLESTLSFSHEILTHAESQCQCSKQFVSESPEIASFVQEICSIKMLSRIAVKFHDTRIQYQNTFAAVLFHML